VPAADFAYCAFLLLTVPAADFAYCAHYWLNLHCLLRTLLAVRAADAAYRDHYWLCYTVNCFC
jgi:hypothetical protein